MTLREWTTDINGRLTAEGFEVSEYEGFPIVRIPPTHEQTVRLLKFVQRVPATKHIYAEGMVFFPVGA